MRFLTWRLYWIWCFYLTVPAQFTSKLRSFASEGLRVLALGYKPFDRNTDFRTIERWESSLYRTSLWQPSSFIATVSWCSCLSVHRGEVEKDMQFLGLLLMKNLVKPESPKVINILRLAHLRSVMVTGEIYFARIFATAWFYYEDIKDAKCKI